MSNAEHYSVEQQRRVGHNEALFRAVNEQIESLNESFQFFSEHFDIVCECGNGDCFELFAVPTADYERVRRDRTLFMLVPGHEIPSAEVVIDENATAYVVVRKHPGGPADLAAKEVPKS